MNWIPILSARPLPSYQLLVLYKNNIADVVKYDGNDFTSDGFEIDINCISYWSYLPEHSFKSNKSN